jgi:hypothetical protein
MKLFLRVFPVLAIFVFLSCKEQPISPETGTADVRGEINLSSGYGYSSLTPPYGGVQVSIDGTGITATTDDTGFYDLKNVPGGTYNFTLSKPGYGTVKWFGVSIQGGGNVPVYINQHQGNYPFPSVLYKNSDLVLSMQSALFEDTSSMYGPTIGTDLLIKGSYRDTAVDISYPEAAMYFSRSSNVSSVPGHYDYVYSSIAYAGYLGATTFFDSTNSSFQIPLSVSVLKLLFGYNSGDSVYVAVYGEPQYSGYFQSNYDWDVYADYYDPVNNIQVLNSANSTPSPVIGFKMP